MKVACDAGSLNHFCDHLAPIWLALPDKYKDGFYARGRAAQRAQELGIPIDGLGQARQKKLVMVASYEDHRRAGNAKVILVNHGAGQRYILEGEGHPSYTGGRDRERVVLNLCPSERDAEVCRASGARAVAVGVPRLDAYHRGQARTPGERPVVAISFHADVHVCPETRSAFGHYQRVINELVRNPDRPFDILGHGHPRWGEFMVKFWGRLGVPFARHFDEVLDKADCYVIDNSSTGPEFASTGRPIVWMSAPWYRRRIHHGGRFWTWTKGLPHVEEPDQLLPNILHALTDDPFTRACREEMVTAVYGDLCDGGATGRAVDAIVRLVDG